MDNVNQQMQHSDKQGYMQLSYCFLPRYNMDDFSLKINN